MNENAILPISWVIGGVSGHLVPSAFEAMRSGLAKERLRLGGRQYLVVAKRRVIDYEGWPDDQVALVESFNEAEPAIALAQQRTDRMLLEDLAVRPSIGEQWRLTRGEAVERFWEEPGTDPGPTGVERLVCLGYRIGDGWYDIRYGVAAVLKVASAEVVDSDLFAYLNADRELVRTLIDIGRSGAQHEAHGLADPGA